MYTYQNDSAINMEIPSEISKLLTNDLKNYLVIKDGHVIKKQLEEQFQNIVIEDVKNKIFGNDIPFEKYPFLSNFKDESYQYNIEEINSGVVIEVPRNVVLTDTLHIFYVQEEIDMVNNTLIVVGENAELKYFEYLYNQSSSSINFVSNSIVKENASLSYSGISKLNRQAMVSVIRNSHVYRYGRANYSVAEINDSTTDSKTSIFLEEKYASGTAKTIAITSLEQEAKFHQLIEHNAPDTEGYIENYGVSNNNSVLVFEGCGKINKLMKRSIARQQNRGIVLGAKSRLDANPLLLIDEYDVEASHGAAIGKIDEEQLYYLMSRGLTLKNAERLIISGFLSPVTKLLSTEALMLDFISSVENKTL